jgi:NAD(P)-dependent dehydrogenase (short-subunit alcohol dehydrogenase family)
MTGRLEDRTAVITGGCSGIGLATARRFADEGAHVVIGDLDTNNGSRLAAELGGTFVETNVTAGEQVEALFAAAKSAGGSVDIAFNNAGISPPDDDSILDTGLDAWRRVQEVNLTSVYLCCKAALPYMREQRSGHVIQVSSIGGVNAFPTLGMYHASKWGLEAFSQSLAAEVAGFGIKVTIIEPGGYSTDWAGPSSVQAERMTAYEEVWDARTKAFAARSAQRGTPEATGPAILELVDAENPPLRVFFGSGGLGMTRAEYEGRIALWEEWDALAQRAQG